MLCLMKCLICSFLLFCSLAHSSPTSETVQSCLQDVMKEPDYKRSQELSVLCLELAKPLEFSKSLSERAVYLSTLIAKKSSEPNEHRLENIVNAAQPYYRQWLKKSITSTQLKKLNNEDLASVYEGLSTLGFYSSLIGAEQSPLYSSLKTFEELTRRSLGNFEQAQDIYLMAISYRNWPKAREIVQNWPGVEPQPLPEIISNPTLDRTKPLYYSLGSSKNTFEENVFISPPGPYIVAVAGCHMATDSFRELSTKTDLRSIMTAYGLTIASSREVDLDKIRSMRDLYPAFEIHPVINSAQWFALGLSTESTPTFYYMYDGVIKYKSYGGTETVNEFCRGLKTIGLGATPSCQ
ncbi:hypothetical protein D3C87_571820 [compost metagenome]